MLWRALLRLSNHPFGILDGLVMGRILSTVRSDFRIMAHQVFKGADELQRVILPVSFDDTKEAVRLNLATRKEAVGFLSEGGAIGLFPGRTVSTAMTPFGQPLDPGWRTFTAKMIASSGATVVPIFFDGHNSRLFQVASHVHYTLRVALLIKEFKKHVGSRVPIVVGDPIEAAEIERRAGSARDLMDFLRSETYALSPGGVDTTRFGFEFEERHRRKKA